LKKSRGAVYYKPRPVSPEDLRLMRRMDELHLERPFAGARMLRDFLGREGLAVGRRHVATLMKRMGIEAIYRRPSTSKPAPGLTADVQNLRLAGNREIVRPVDHRFALSKPALVSAPSKKSFSSASSPIFA
jgi:hypothetical protein